MQGTNAQDAGPEEVQVRYVCWGACRGTAGAGNGGKEFERACCFVLMGRFIVLT